MRRARRGVQAVELALTFPLWLGLLVGVGDTCWLLGQRATFGAAVEAGCRDGALVAPGVATAAVEAVVQARTEAFLGTLDATPCPTCDVQVSTTGTAPARTLVCVGTREASGLTRWWFGTSTLTARRTARLQQQQGGVP